MTVETLACIIDAIIWLGLIIMFVVEVKIIKNRLDSIETNTTTRTDKLLEWIDKNSFDISNAVNNIKDTLDDFQIEYKEIGKMLDELNCPIYKIEFAKKNEIFISYDFKTVTMKLDDGKIYTYTKWDKFKDDFISALSVRVTFKNEPVYKKTTSDEPTEEKIKEITNEIDVASAIIDLPKKKKRTSKKKQ